MEIKQYLQNSLLNKADNESLCVGWEYLKNNIPEQLKEVLENNEYWELKYNSQKEQFIINQFNLNELSKEDLKQLSAFVYIQNDERREQEKIKKEQDILCKGYIKINSWNNSLHGKKVKGLFEISKIGLMGSYDDLTEMEGTLFFNESYKCLMITPKGSRTRGHLLKTNNYLKEVL